MRIVKNAGFSKIKYDFMLENSNTIVYNALIVRYFGGDRFFGAVKEPPRFIYNITVGEENL